MEFLSILFNNPFSNFFVNNILAKPEFLIGIIVFVGYLLLKKPIYECYAGLVKAIVGYMILNVGAGGLVTTFRPILAGLKDRFGLTAVVIDPYFGLNAVDSALKSIGQTTSWTTIALLIGFMLNIILVLFKKYTKLRTLFITGHIMLQQVTTATWIIFYLFPQFRNSTGALLIGIFCGVYWSVSSNLTVGPTQRLTENAGFAIGHQQMFAVWFTDKVAAKIGNPNKKLDDIKLPKWLSVFHDDIVSTSSLMLLFFGLIMLVLGKETMAGIDKSFNPETINFFMYIVSKSLLFAVYLAVLRMGVRMFISELTTSFQGISSKILPGVLPAVDCAAVYGFGSPNAVLFGFICGALGQFISIIGLIVFKSPVFIITGFVPVFFDNATIAVYADKRGGARAAAILSFASGVLQVFGGVFAVLMFALQDFGGWHGNIDQSTVWLVQGAIMKYLKFPPVQLFGYIVVIVTMLLIPIMQYKMAKNKADYDNNLI